MVLEYTQLMIHNIYTAVLYKPLYNAFIGIISAFPWIDAGIVVIIFTVLVKLVLFPLSQKSVKSNIEIKKIQPEIDAIKVKYKDNKQEQALKTMELYKLRGVNPFAGIFLVLIQLPILFALYKVFYGNSLVNINTELLYSFVHVPDHIKLSFLGLFDITQKNTILALVVALGQYFQIKFTMPAVKKTVPGEPKDTSFQGELARSMSMQMKYMMPVVMFIFAYNFPATVSLYLITASVFAIGQELYMRKKLEREDKPITI